MDYIEVCKTTRLQGSVRIQGSKNSSLALIAAACLSDGTVILENIPDTSDIHTFLAILSEMGAKAEFIDSDCLSINPGDIENPVIDSLYTSKVRPAYYFIGALLCKHKKIKLGYPGGDRIGPRPIDQHIKGLKAMGAHFEFFDDHYIVSADNLTGCDVFFDLITGGATLNVMMAAVLSKGTTTIYNAARDPEVVDTAILLNKMGAHIHGAGTDTIRIDGVESLSGTSHAVIPDRLIAGTYLIAAGVTGGHVTVTNIIPEHLIPFTNKLKETGIDISIMENRITAVSDGKIKSVNIVAEKFPMFETDFQQPASILLLKADGVSSVIDKVYPQRSNHCDQLIKMGAGIKWVDGAAIITGGFQLNGADVYANDIRAGACLVLAGLLAEGKTRITGVENIIRGFADIIGDFSKLGAEIDLFNNYEIYNKNDDSPSLNNRVIYDVH
ncbi:MAG: UDP-N-acetylglucosamine 1-carboxyvinyltransferase [Saccharofermentanales bacterium]